jgi:nicotinamide phosphoribosyltransferase
MTSTTTSEQLAVAQADQSYGRRVSGKRFDQYGRLRPNLILATDIYKFSHPFAYPSYINGMYANQEPRTKGDIIVPVGMQMLLWKTLANPITADDIDEAEEFCKANGAMFSREPWEYILACHAGYLPVKVRTVREGTPVPSGNVIVTVECVDKEVAWITSFIETFLLRGVWYPTTVASNDRQLKVELKTLYESSGANVDALVWALNDFGARGVASSEQAEIGGMAHLAIFSGSDNTEGIRAANMYYFEAMASYGVPATEHSIECSFGLDEAGEEEYLEHIIKSFAKPGGILAIVIDGKDVFRATRKLCSPKFVKLIQECGAKVVFRPDSGDMMVVVPWILEQQRQAFGFKMNDKGFMVLNNVGVIQGDGIDKLTARQLIAKITLIGYSADCIVLGSGGGLLQKVNRDTYKFAQKASAIRIDPTVPGGAERIAKAIAEKKQVTETPDGTWIGISKDPVTDPGKRSKEGRVTLVTNGLGDYASADLDGDLPRGYEDALVTVYDCGKLYNRITLTEVRANAAV